MKRFSMIILCFMLVLSMSLTAYATGTVTYDGYANEFIFEPGSDYSPTDLFPGFKNVMPGDQLEDQVVIFNDSSKKIKVRVYMRALGAQEDTDEFLSQMTLTVKKQNDSTLFDAPADETAQLTDWVYLGTLYSGGEITLNLLLDVPIEMGNEFQNKIGYLDWEFKVEEIPIQTPGVQTGDDSNLIFYGGMMVLSFAMVTILLVAVIRRKRTEKT